jgi:hypothetical protein
VVKTRMLKASETAPLAQDGRSPLSNPLQSYISAGVHRVRGGTRQTVPAQLVDQRGSGRDIKCVSDGTP